MKLEKAIEIGQETCHQYEKHLLSHQRFAFRILIEAGKRLNDHRFHYVLSAKNLLPGETEE